MTREDALGALMRKLPATYRAILALIATFALGWGASMVLGGHWGLPARVTVLEAQMATHVDSVSTPGMARIRSLERGMEDLQVTVRQVHELYCDRFPDRCDPRPRQERPR